MAAVRFDLGRGAGETLEAGNALILPDTAIGLSVEDVEILRHARLDNERS
jgi:hypothetical protein